MAKGYIAFVLDDKSRQELLEEFPARFVRTIAHHVTLKFGCCDTELQEVMNAYNNGYPIGYMHVLDHLSDDTIGVQCVTVAAEEAGHSVRFLQTNGKKLHITISVAEGTSPVASNRITDRSTNMTIDGLILCGEIKFIPFAS